jgi:hypothetical protein
MIRPTAVLAILLTGGVVANAIEEPAFEVVESTDVYEVRRYAPYIVAETTVNGDFGSAGGKAFRILAGYIFGNNEDSTKMKMTAPVETRPALESTSMVTSGKNGSSAYTVGFVMESQYGLDTLPAPKDGRVSLREVPARTVAALRYSGRWTEGNYQKHERRLLVALDDDGYATIAPPMLARYNGPMTPWFLRRNEVLVEVEKP